LLVDVREPDEVAAVGFADCEQLLIPMSEIEVRWQEIPRDRAVNLGCAVGVRSLKATNFLMYQRYTRVANMQCGMKRWAARGFPVTGDVAAAGAETGGSCCGGAAEPAAEMPASRCGCAASGCC
jgi:rhodanese-related sulfurtransferase